MAVATSMAIIGGLGLAKGAFDTISAAKRQNNNKPNSTTTEQLTNKFKDMQISHIGSRYDAKIFTKYGNSYE
jgi:hypothetical protein